MPKNNYVILLTIVLMLGCCLLSFFVKPRPPFVEIVTPKDELPTYEARLPGDMNLANRLIKSYEMAMILVQSPFTQNNISALEGIREWAREEFQRQPDFLHPVKITFEDPHRGTVFGAMGYTLFAPVRFWLEEQTMGLLHVRVKAFHETRAYRSFNKAFFDFFGTDADAATLLARYESDRAKLAVDVLLWVAAWIVGAFAAIRLLVANRHRDWFGAIQLITAGVWGFLAVQYLMAAWEDGQNANLISAVLALCAAGYLLKPFVLASHQEGGQQLLFVRLSPRLVALAAWLTISMLCVQVLTWVRTGIPISSDPITLLLCSLSGNFVHEPSNGKRLVTGIVAGVWLLASLWSWRQRQKDALCIADDDEGLEKLDHPVDYQTTA